ncbi:MAG: peptidoglycan-associated lipoprotein Pal [Nitrospirota bacterium]
MTMRRAWQSVCLVGAMGGLLLLAPGCSKKIGADAGAGDFQPGAAKQDQSPAASAQREPAISERTTREGRPEEGRSSQQAASAPEPAGSGDNSLKGFEPVTPGKSPKEEQLGGELMVARAEPSEAARQGMEERQKEQLATTAAGLADVYFAFDSVKITKDGEASLAQDAEWLKANPNQRLTIEGHCDERGTQAYNMVLGEKRAKTVRNYLIELGVAPERLIVASYGKDRPFCKEHEETCYRQNRRAHLVVRAQ